MALLDPKEDLFKIILTQYGRKKLSEGDLKVEYYAFVDDEVDYEAGELPQTGSESTRFSQIQNHWLVFEPISDEEVSLRNFLFSVALGQDKAPIMHIESGSASTITGSILIEKEIHIFDDESAAVEFLTEMGSQNISSYTETEIESEIGSSKLIEIHVINFPEVKLDLAIIDGPDNGGFIIEPFLSGSSLDVNSRVDLEPVSSKIVFDNTGRLISDTYLRFFVINSDIDDENLVDNTSVSVGDGNLFGRSDI